MGIFYSSDFRHWFRKDDLYGLTGLNLELLLGTVLNLWPPRGKSALRSSIWYSDPSHLTYKEKDKVATCGRRGEKDGEEKEGNAESTDVLESHRRFCRPQVHPQPLNGWFPTLREWLSLTAIYANTHTLVGCSWYVDAVFIAGVPWSTGSSLFFPFPPKRITMAVHISCLISSHHSFLQWLQSPRALQNPLLE